MKKKHINTILFFCMMVSIIIATSCVKEEDDLGTPRLFKPRLLVDASADNQFTIVWLPIKGAVQYKLDISRDAFATIDQSFTLADSVLGLRVLNIIAATDYYIRIKSINSDTTLNSKYFVTTVTSASIYENTNEILDIVFRAKWVARGLPVSKIQIKLASNDSLVKEVAISETESAAQIKEIAGLRGSSTYTVSLYSGEILRGKGTITTKPEIANSVDLRVFDAQNDSVFSDTIANVPSGYTVILKRGRSYRINATQILEKSITFLSGYAFNDSLATIVFYRNFNFKDASTIDSVVFRDLLLKSSNGYAIQSNSTGCKVDKVIFDGCRLHAFRGIFRIQLAETVNNLVFNNCVIDSLGDYGITRIYQTTTNIVKNITLKNSTVFDARRGFINTKYLPNTAHTLNIENCTFYNSPLGGNFLIDYGTDATIQGSVTIKNCIFGAVLGTTAGSGFRFAPNVSVTVSNSYVTSDFNVTTALPDLISYSGNSTTLFTDPLTANYKIKDTGFAGRKTAGDPRWRLAN